MSNGDTLEVVETFLSDTEGKLPPEISKRDQIILIAIKAVRNETRKGFKNIEKKMEASLKPVSEIANTTSDIVRGEKKRNEKGSLVNQVEQNTRFVKGAIYILGAISLAFLSAVGAGAAGWITISIP